jgi:UDPglucose 6-dehydrogenase
MRIAIFGSGYVGLVTAVCFAELGHSVVAVDNDRNIVARLADGIPTVYEPGLAELLSANLRAGRLRFTTSAPPALDSSEIVFLCVGTPALPDGSADLSQVDDVVAGIAPGLNGYTLLVEKSTVPVDTATCIGRAMRQLTGPHADFEVASNPEFLREGSAIQDFLHPDRIVIGADSDRARSRLLGLYQHDFTCPILVTSVKMAELIKHAANAYLSTKISFINMVADLCESVGGDVSVVARGIGLDHRIGPHFLQAGLGFGGSCFGKDLKAFVRIAEEHGVDFDLLREVERINAARVDRFLKKVDRALWVVRNKTLGVLGVAFKANTDDVRDAPSLRLIPELLQRGASLQIYDPQAASAFGKVHPPDDRVRYVTSPYEAAQDAHGLLILTDWDEFRTLDWDRLRSAMRSRVIIDGRNLFDPSTMREQDFEYFSLGRGDVRFPPASEPVQPDETIPSRRG